MTLIEYLRENQVTQAAFAARLGVTQGLVSQWLNGTTVITPERAKSIEDATEGAVRRHELRPDVFDAPAAGCAA